MFQNYFNIALRTLRKHGIHTAVNVVGLALGLASVFLIARYIRSELGYDRFHHDAENLYRVTWEDENPQTRTPHPMAQALVNDFPEVEHAVSLSPLWAAGLTRETHSFRNLEQDERFDERDILSVDTTFFDVFDFPLVLGNPGTALKKINGILISESMARKYFGDENPMGKQLAVDSDVHLAEITGVFKDVPHQSHFHFDFLVSYVREKAFDPGDPYFSWSDFGHYNYIRLKPGTDAKALEEKLLPWVRKYIDVSEPEYEQLRSSGFGFRLQPVTDIHLHSRLRWELEPNGNIDYLYLLGAAGLLTLVIACVNFMNLTTAKSAERAKEIGVRKSVGAQRHQLAMQFLSESVLTALAAVVVAIIFIELALPFFNNATGMSHRFDYLTDLPVLAAFGMFIGVVSGLYPAAYLSKIGAHLVLKGKLVQSPRGSAFRHSLIVFQFCISMVLITGSAIIFNQLKFLQDKRLGFRKEEVILVALKNDGGISNFETLRSELLQTEGIVSVSAASNVPGRQYNQHPVSALAAPQHRVSCSEAFVDYDFFSSLDIELHDGRVFSREYPSDTGAVFVLNETAAKQLFFDESAVGQEVVWHHDESDIRGTVIGVVKDFHFQSLHEPIRPLLFALSHEAFNYIIVRTGTEHLERKIAAMETAYKRVEPYFAFEFSFLEDQLNAQYAFERQTAGILAAFSFIAIAIACFGLFAMSMLTFQQKLKEISVRKVLGASGLNLIVLLIGGFTRLIAISVLLGAPIAWWIMDRWLENFTYQVTIEPLVFLASGLVLLVIAWCTLGYFTIRASKVNPAVILKNE